jgi:hypothetical protein
MKLQRLRWNDAAAEALREVTAEDSETVARDVQNGHCELWCVDDHSLAVTCVDNDSRELIICCYTGRDVVAFAHAMYKIARGQNLVAVRFFTKRKGLGRMFERAGFPLKVYGTVYRCEVPPNVCS